MEINPTIQTLLNPRSVRKYQPEPHSDEVVEAERGSGHCKGLLGGPQFKKRCMAGEHELNLIRPQ